MIDIDYTSNKIVSGPKWQRRVRGQMWPTSTCPASIAQVLRHETRSLRTRTNRGQLLVHETVPKNCKNVLHFSRNKEIGNKLCIIENKLNVTVAECGSDGAIPFAID